MNCSIGSLNSHLNMLSFLYIVLAFAIQPSFSLVPRGITHKHSDSHKHQSHTILPTSSTTQTGSNDAGTTFALCTISPENVGSTSSLFIPNSTEAHLSSSATFVRLSSSMKKSTLMSTSTRATTFTSKTPTTVPISSQISTTTLPPSTNTAKATTFTSKTQTTVPLSLQISTTTPPPSASTARTVVPSSSGSYWKPTVSSTWQIQLQAPLTNFSSSFSIIDLDLVDNPTSTISTLHSLSVRVICYFSAGTYENWRPDASSFLPSDLGSTVAGWNGEWWLNTNSANVRSIMTARIELAASKGCDGVDPDNVDGYDNDTGFSLTQADAVDYLSFLADAAHSRGLAIGLKNAGDIVGDVLTSMDWQVNEQCIEYDECSLFTPFVEAGKPVFHIEYPSDAPDVSSNVKDTSCAAPSGFSSVLKMLDLDSWIEPC